ncbi:MAG TPA: hypothetical protein PLS62_06160, partial [Desulfobacteraceae bacterium]|nr:hypothetical protein [Desulfobacteraceae bacterium]
NFLCFTPSAKAAYQASTCQFRFAAFLFFSKYPGIYSVAEKEVGMIRCEFTHIYGRSGVI